MRGKAVPNPWGDPALEPGEEREFRKRMVERALEALHIRVEHPTVFEVKEYPLPGKNESSPD